VEENIPLAILVFIVPLTGTILCTGINGRPDMNYLNNGSNIFLYYLAGCIGTVILSSLSMVLVWGHAANSDFGLVYTHVVSFLTLAVISIPIVIINKYFPFMLGKRKPA
jgi:ACR3 family arsenite efflux pump ArsB